MAEVLLDLGAEGRHAPVVNDVLEPGSLAVGAIAEVAKDLEDRLADREHVAAVDVTERHGQEWKRLLRARGRAQPAADQDVVTDQPPALRRRPENRGRWHGCRCNCLPASAKAVLNLRGR